MNRTRRAAVRLIGCLLLGLAISGFLATSAPASDEPSSEDIAALIEQLGDPDFIVRDRAQKKLGQLGEKAYTALTIAANDSDLEVAARARYLLLTIELPVVRDSDSDPVKETLEGYSGLSTSDQILRVQLLLLLPEGQGYRAACRLAHIENSVTMSKYIATTILNHWPVYDRGRTRMQEAVEAELKQSGQTAARWLVSYARLDSDTESSLDPWRELVKEEESLLEQRSPRTSEQVVAALLYSLAYTAAQHDAPAVAQKHFEQAQQQKLPSPDAATSFYFDTGRYFRNRGKIDWAAEVFGQIWKLGDASAQPTLAEMFHDAGRNADAAAAMDVILELLTPERLGNSRASAANQIRARKHFLLACQARDSGDDEKYRAELLEAVKIDPGELDVLIALYRIPDLEEATRKNTIAMIEVAAERLRHEATASPDDAQAHNEFAWLVGNTTGDMEEALKHALRAVELRPESGALLDTLAHVYFYGLKDYDKAVETQAKAVEFSPHSGLIRQKYELFRKAADERKAQ